jgi:dynein heavy chain
VGATISIYNKIVAELLPTPAKSHYTFNLRDISKVFQGVLMVDARITSNPDTVVRLWIHETSRVFYDRLICQEDRRWFTDNICKILL